jgi:hypothetical protein
MSPFARCIALCLTIVMGSVGGPSVGLAQEIPAQMPAAAPVPPPPRTPGLWAAVGIGSGLAAGSIILAGVGLTWVRNNMVLDCMVARADSGCRTADEADRINDRRYWRVVGGSLALGVVGLAVGVWGIVGVRRARRAHRVHAALEHLELSVDPRAPRLSWGARF